ncbi:MAG: hypothetical protein IIC78_05790 [Chloroflexi bacterium]|nr:hypothetical protein [Chloroflexota bacterium]
MNIISLLSSILAAAFAIAVFNRYRHSRRLFLLLWAFGLFLYGLGTLTEVLSSLTFNTLILKIWYLSGAMLTAAWLGQGTIQLLVRKRKVASVLLGGLIILSTVSLVLVALAPTTSAAAGYDISQPLSSQYKDILTRSGVIVFLTIILNIYGTIGLVGGAIYSAFIFWRKRILANRMLGNVLIAAGALSPALGGSFLRAGLADMLYASEFLGIILMYAGFLLATRKEKEPEAEPQPVAG